MIRRVQTHPAPPSLTIAALPPGTVTNGPLNVVFINPGTSEVAMIPADSLITSDGRFVYATGPANWGQLYEAGRRG